MSCQIIKERERVTEIEYQLIFDMDGHGNGIWIPCDENGNIVDNLNESMKKNYQWCLDHPEKFICKPYVHKTQWSYMENAIAQCHCGEKFELYDEYMGACDCPKCGQWYNLFGQELKNPYEWEEDIEEDY